MAVIYRLNHHQILRAVLQYNDSMRLEVSNMNFSFNLFFQSVVCGREVSSTRLSSATVGEQFGTSFVT